jgi:aldehyde dehydrogenase (NAD+)
MVEKFELPEKVLNYIKNEDTVPENNSFFDKLNPHDSTIISKVARSDKKDVDKAVKLAKKAQKVWGEYPPVKRGEILYDIIDKMIQYREQIAKIVAIETGKSLASAYGETGGAIACARFYAGEGQRLYAKTCTSGVDDKYAMTIREPVGVTGLIIAANTPIANVAWKVFPALICGNSVILKSAEDTPLTAWIFGKIVNMTELPPGAFNIIHGLGVEAGAPIVEHKDVDLISFTGSTSVGRYVAKTAGERLAIVSLELGGKNPIVVCDDADLENAAKWIVLSAFSNAGQRCASCSRVIVFDSVYEELKKILLDKTSKLKVGPSDDDDLGPVINEKQLKNMLKYVNEASDKGAKILIGGNKLSDEEHVKGFYMAPTILEDVGPEDDIAITELFGPITILFKVSNFKEALDLANNSPYGLTATIHTKNVNRATEFSRKIQSGVAVINGGTYGSEPHMPFGGVKISGNGSREPGTEALDIYCNLKDIYHFVYTDDCY